MMKRQRPYILISNDDGFFAKGINFLIDTLKDEADIIVVAPDSARSGYALAITSMLPVQAEMLKDEEHLKVYACTGTPGDCIKLALNRLVERKPDLVISGINHGDNSSVNTHYSGTMGIAREGCLKYIPSIAFSSCDYNPDANLEPLRHYVVKIVKQVLKEGLPKGVCLNVNFPARDNFKGIKIRRMGYGSWLKETLRCEHPRGFDYYWMLGKYRNDEPSATDTDQWALKEGYVTITPTRIDITDYDMLDKMKAWEE